MSMGSVRRPVIRSIRLSRPGIFRLFLIHEINWSISQFGFVAGLPPPRMLTNPFHAELQSVPVAVDKFQNGYQAAALLVFNAAQLGAGRCNRLKIMLITPFQNPVVIKLNWWYRSTAAFQAATHSMAVASARCRNGHRITCRSALTIDQSGWGRLSRSNNRL